MQIVKKILNDKRRRNGESCLSKRIENCRLPGRGFLPISTSRKCNFQENKENGRCVCICHFALFQYYAGLSAQGQGRAFQCGVACADKVADPGKVAAGESAQVIRNSFGGVVVE